MANRLRVVDPSAPPEPSTPPALDEPTFHHWCIACEHHHVGPQLDFSCALCPCSKRPGATLSGGPKRCPRHCSECLDEKGAHHFIEDTGNHHDEPRHEAARAGHPEWYVCKHCEAWSVEPGVAS